MLDVRVAVAAAFGFTLLSAWRLLTRRFLHPADLATISVFYYTVPLALIAIVLGDDSGLIFLHRAAADYGIAVQSIHWALLAMACLEIGRWCGRTFHKHSALQFPLQPADRAKASALLVFFLGLIALGILLYGPGAFFAGYATPSSAATASLGNALIYASIEFIGLTMGYMFLVSRAAGTRFMSPLLVVVMGVLVFLAVARGKRLEIVSAFFPIGVLLFGTHPWFRNWRSRLVSGGVAAILISLLASIRLNQTPNVAVVVFNLLSEGFFAGHSLPGVIDRLQVGSLEYENGVRVGLALLAFVPRFIWPTKDDIVYVGNEALSGVAPGGATNILAEVLLQGGAVAVVIAYVAMGFVSQRAYVSQQRFDAAIGARRLPWGTLFYLILLATFVPHFRDGLIPSIKMLMQASLFLFVLGGWKLTGAMTWRAMRTVRLPAGA